MAGQEPTAFAREPTRQARKEPGCACNRQGFHAASEEETLELTDTLWSSAVVKGIPEDCRFRAP